MISKPKYKLARRLGAGIHEKTMTQKFMLSQARRAKSRGMKKRPKPLSEYGRQLIEKQKVRFSYGITETQLGNYIEKAMHAKKSTPIVKLSELLESRLDNGIYRLGLAPTRPAARQMVSHGHIIIGGKRMTTPSYGLKIGDIIRIREGSLNKSFFIDLSKKLKNFITPEWIKFDPEKMQGEVKGMPKTADPFFDFEAVLEFYSR